MSEPPSSPPNQHTSPEDAIAYYKRQYEALEAELTDFRISSQELEAELEKDAELAEGKERVWREKAEGLAFEVDEWKACRLPISWTSAPVEREQKLTQRPDQIQAVQGRSKCCTNHFTEGNHDAAGHD